MVEAPSQTPEEQKVSDLDCSSGQRRRGPRPPPEPSRTSTRSKARGEGRGPTTYRIPTRHDAALWPLDSRCADLAGTRTPVTPLEPPAWPAGVTLRGPFGGHEARLPLLAGWIHTPSPGGRYTRALRWQRGPESHRQCRPREGDSADHRRQSPRSRRGRRDGRRALAACVGKERATSGVAGADARGLRLRPVSSS